MMKKLTTIALGMSLSMGVMSQTISSVNPASGYQGQSMQLTVSGTDLDFVDATSTTVWLEIGSDQVSTNYLSVQETSIVTELVIPLNAPVGTYDVHFGEVANSFANLPNGFEVLAALPTPTAPVLNAPANSAELTSNPVSFEWSGLPNIAAYQLQVSLTSDFSVLYTNVSYLTQNNYLDHLPTGVHYWRVRAKNLSGLWSGWSSVRSFELIGTSQLTSMNPNTGHAGQSGLQVSISGVSLPFSEGTPVGQEIRIQQNNYEIAATSPWISSPNEGQANFDIPLNAPVGYYSLIYENSLFNPLELENAFYVTEGNTFTGRVFIDQNQNQVYDNGDIPYPYAMISASPGSVHALTRSDGSYQGHVPSGNFALTLGNIDYFTHSPSQHSVSFSGSGGTDAANDFVLQPVAGVHDVSVSLSNDIPPRPGLEMMLYVIVRNEGPVVESGQFDITFPSGMSLVASSNPDFTLVGNTATWNFGPIQPFGSVVTTVYLATPLSAQIGDQLTFVGQVNIPSEDAAPADNVFTLSATVVNSYDPNFKEVIPSEFISQEFLNNEEYLYYTIHFQNLGTAEAIDIYILDTISDYLDLGSLQVLSASHDNVVRILNDRLVEFRFDGINLPDSVSNEPESHGFISYRIRPNSAFGLSDIIRNTAYIYFDFNEAVVTNTTENWIPTGIESEVDASWQRIARNPVTGSYEITCPGRFNISVFNVVGSMVHQQTLTDRYELNLSDRPAGVYLLRIDDGTRSSTHKLLVQ